MHILGASAVHNLTFNAKLMYIYLSHRVFFFPLNYLIVCFMDYGIHDLCGIVGVKEISPFILLIEHNIRKNLENKILI